LDGGFTGGHPAANRGNPAKSLKIAICHSGRYTSQTQLGKTSKVFKRRKPAC
jgi:hypothetical protein